MLSAVLVLHVQVVRAAEVQLLVLLFFFFLRTVLVLHFQVVRLCLLVVQLVPCSAAVASCELVIVVCL